MIIIDTNSNITINLIININSIVFMISSIAELCGGDEQTRNNVQKLHSRRNTTPHIY